MKRLVIYFHYDPAGRIDTACRIAVQAMQKYAKVLFVTNGTLTPADRVWVRQAGAGRIERDNTGFDVGEMCIRDRPKERHYFIETNYTQYIHAHHKRDLETTRAIIARKCPEYLPAYDLYMSCLLYTSRCV